LPQPFSHNGLFALRLARCSYRSAFQAVEKPTLRALCAVKKFDSAASAANPLAQNERGSHADRSTAR
jgi:hypothetical protein